MDNVIEFGEKILERQLHTIPIQTLMTVTQGVCHVIDAFCYQINFSAELVLPEQINQKLFALYQKAQRPLQTSKEWPVVQMYLGLLLTEFFATRTKNFAITKLPPERQRQLKAECSKFLVSFLSSQIEDVSFNPVLLNQLAYNYGLHLPLTDIIALSPETIEKIQALFPKILAYSLIDHLNVWFRKSNQEYLPL